MMICSKWHCLLTESLGVGSIFHSYETQSHPPFWDFLTSMTPRREEVLPESSAPENLSIKDRAVTQEYFSLLEKAGSYLILPP